MNSIIFKSVTVVVFIAAYLTSSFSSKVVTGKSNTAIATVVNDTNPRFLVISDVHLHDSTRQYIAYTPKGDSGNDLWDTTKKKITKILKGHNPPKFIVLLGDLPFHTNNRTRAKHNIAIVLKDMQTIAGTIPIIYVPGNNDSPFDHDGSYSLNFIPNHGKCKTCWPFFCGGLHSKLPIVDYDSLLGCYSCYPLGKTSRLRVIVLNTVIFLNDYKPMNGRSHNSDATQEMDWLATQLNDAKNKGEHVLLTMHVPPGKDFMGKDFWDTALKYKGETVQNAFLDMTARYQKIIVGALTSHTHFDGIRRFHGSDSSFILLGLSVPGIAPGHGNYPGMDVVTYNPANYALLNFETWYLPYEHAQDSINKKLTNHWEEFDFDKLFGNKEELPISRFIKSMPADSFMHAIYMRENEGMFKYLADKYIDVYYQ